MIKTRCKNCNKLFEKHTWYHLFCNDNCRQEYKNKINPNHANSVYSRKNAKKKACKVCGERFVPDIFNPTAQKFCSKRCKDNHYHQRKLKGGEKKSKMTSIKIKDIKIPENIRKDANDANIPSLMQDIKQNGLLHPIGVWKNGKGYYLAFGHRRLTACRKLGFKELELGKEIKILDRAYNKKDFLAINTAENIHREDISPVEFARIVKALKSEGLNDAEISIRLSVAISKVQNALSMLQKVPKEYLKDITYSPSLQDRRRKQGISTIIATRIVNQRLRKADVKELFRVAKKENLTVAQVELIGRLIQTSKISIKEAIKQRKKFVRKSITCVASKEGFKKLDKSLKSNDLSLQEYVIQVLNGRRRAIKGVFM